MKITALLSITTIVASLLPSQISAGITAYVEFPPHAISGTTTTVPVHGARIAFGDAQKTVEKNLGTPMTRLSADAWFLENLVITLTNGRQLQSKNLLLVFSDGKLSSVTAVCDKNRAQVLANATREARVKTVASNRGK
jgi:hypothetical protein